MMQKLISIFILGLVLISCGPSPEAMAKKTCALAKQYREAEAQGDSTKMESILTEIQTIENKIKEDHKSNADWLTTYSINRDACIIEDRKKEEK